VLLDFVKTCPEYPETNDELSTRIGANVSSLQAHGKRNPCLLMPANSSMNAKRATRYCVRNPEIAALFLRFRKMPADAIGPNPVEKPNPGKQSQN
jgi:hypothetical protein